MLTKDEFNQLSDALFYMNMKELKEICLDLSLPSSGNKKEKITCILHYIEKGEILLPEAIPEHSKAINGNQYPLAEKTLILYGNYKNDLRTRNFLKKLIGSHFHFTAFGIDWIKERWMKKNPPTYGEFALFWEEEYQNRKRQKATPKEEWAYINFMQKYSQSYPQATKSEMLKNWKKMRLHHVNTAQNFIKKIK